MRYQVELLCDAVDGQFTCVIVGRLGGFAAARHLNSSLADSRDLWIRSRACNSLSISLVQNIRPAKETVMILRERLLAFSSATAMIATLSQPAAAAPWVRGFVVGTYEYAFHYGGRADYE